MKKQRLIPGPVLMIITMLVITGFQLFWLRKNYAEAKRNLEMHANGLFERTVRSVEIKTFKLGSMIPDQPPLRRNGITFEKDADPVEEYNFHDEAFETIEELQKKIPDSVTVHQILIQKRKESGGKKMDSVQISYRSQDTSGKKLFRIVLDLDSIHDTIQLPTLVNAYHEVLVKQNMDIPFSIMKAPPRKPGEDDMINDVTAGFGHPATFRLLLGNTFPYVIRKISIPIFFSVFLVGITFLSFLVLYKNLLRQRRLSAIKNEFISNMTHELKTPIATVGVAIEALKNFNAIHDEQKTKEYLDISSNELQRLNLLVDKVLKLSMFEKKEIELNPETINVKETAEEVINSMRLQIEKNHAKVSLTGEGDTTIQADKLHLQSVVFNLLDNALKYTKENPVINIDVQEKENSVQLTITDNGIGIAPEYKDKIFEKFFRVPIGDRHDAKGYGLGLSYVSQVIEKHKGTIEVESKPNTGTTFIINLPKAS